MASQPDARLTMEQYLELERAATGKHEFIDGDIVAMSGGTPRHSIITVNIGGHFHSQLKGTGCVPFSPDVKVYVARSKMIAYPDVTIVCGDPEFLDSKRDVIKNPTVMVEVLSPSTKNHDRGEKATLYRLMPSVQEFLLVGQDPVFVEYNRRLADGTWQIIIYQALSDEIRLDSIRCTLPVSEIYSNIEKYGSSGESVGNIPSLMVARERRNPHKQGLW